MTFTDWILPITAVFIIVYGLIKGTPVMDCFIEGAKEGFSTFLSILPALIALVAAVSVLKASGGLDVILWFMKPIASITGIPSDVLPLVLAILTSYTDILVLRHIVGNELHLVVIRLLKTENVRLLVPEHIDGSRAPELP